jgi:K(+)-stimulated pyrophosphate-energized sodium pump
LNLALIAPISGIVALIFATYLAIHVLKKPKGNGRILDISNTIKEGTMAFLNRQFITVTFFGVILTVILGLTLGFYTTLTFIVGAVFSAFSAYFGVIIAIHTNVRTAESAKHGIKEALKTSFDSGTIIGMSLAGLGLLAVSSLYFVLKDPFLLVGLGFGASLIGLFARVGGGIFTKAADIGADLVGKVEMGFPEDDPRNPAVIADQVGDNVGDVAGTGSDVFQSYVCTLVAAMILGITIYGKEGLTYPLVVLGAGILSSLIGSFFVKINHADAKSAINRGMYVAAIFIIIASGFASWEIFNSFNAFYATLAGIIAVVIFAHLTEYYTSPDKSPVRNIANASKTGAATNIIMGFATSFESVAIPIIVFSVAIMAAYFFDQLYGITLLAVGFLSITSTFIAMSSYGPIVDNAHGMIEMSGLSSKVNKVMDKLDSVGNVTKAICKVYAIGTSALAQVALISAYIGATGLQSINVTKPPIVAGLLIGGMLSFLLVSMIIKAVGKAAYKMIEEVRRQFKKNHKFRNGEKPNYARCVDISTKAAIRGMILPAFLSVVVPLSVGIMLGREAMGGFIVGNLVTMFPLALMMCIGGAAWDNAKKFIEAGNLGGKGTFTHSAAIVGDTVGDPLKDAAGPALDVFINLIGTVALLYATSSLAYFIVA